MNNEYEDQKQGSKQLLLGVWLIENDSIDEKERGDKGSIESVFEEVEEELNELTADVLSKGVWIIKYDENNQLITQMKNKLKSIFHEA